MGDNTIISGAPQTEKSVGASLVLIEKNGAIGQITLNQPQTRNAISELAMVEALTSALRMLDADSALRVLIITGAGLAFCSGGNVKHMANREDMFAGDAAQLYENYRKGIQQIPLTMQAIEIPVIAAVNGAAYGAGCDLAMMSDLRLAARSATFAENFVKVGIIPGDGGAWFLPRVIGWARASELALTGEPITAEKALDWGMVSAVHDDESLIAEAWKLAERVAVNPRQALRATKKLLREGMLSDLNSHLDKCALIQAQAHHSADHAEAVRAILEKRAPDFKNS